jgi:hypothetical protein
MRLWTIIFIVICTNLSFAQKDVLQLEWEIFQSENDSMANYYLLEKLNQQAGSKQWQEAYETLERIRWHYLPDTIIDQLNPNAAIISFLAENPYRSKFYFEEWVVNEADTTKEIAFLGIMNYFDDPKDSLLFKTYLRKLVEIDSAYICFECLEKAANYQMPNRRFWRNSSKVIPGMGTIRSGNALKGMTSLAFNGGILYNTYFFAAGGIYAASAFWGVAIFQMFYSGNLVLTRLSIEDFEERKQSKLMNSCKTKSQNVILNLDLRYKPIKVYF